MFTFRTKQKKFFQRFAANVSDKFCSLLNMALLSLTIVIVHNVSQSVHNPVITAPVEGGDQHALN